MNILKYKNEYFEDMARVFKLLGSPIKLKLINYISFCPRTVEECARKFDQSVQNISLHLIALHKAGVLDVEQIKNFRYYSLSSNHVVQIVSKALLSDPRTLLPEELLWKDSEKDLLKGISKKRIHLIDLRDNEESSYIPLKGAIRYDGKVSQLVDFLKSLPKHDQLVFVCKGRMCERLAASVEAAANAHLNAKGLPLSAGELKDFGRLLN